VKKLVLLAISLALAAALFANYRNGQALAEKDRLQKEEEARVSKLEADLAREKRRNQSDVQTEQKIVDDLKQQFAAEKAALETLQQRFDTARNRGGPGGEYTADIESKLLHEKDALQEIDAQIKSVKAQESDLGKQGSLAKEQQRLGNRQNQVDLEAQIHQQEALIRANQDQLNQLKAQGSVDPDVRASRKQLAQQIKDAKVLLQSLKDARPQLAVQGGAAVNQLDSQVQDGRTQLRLSREQLEERSRQEKGAIADLQKQLDEAKRDQSGQKQAQSRLQADYQAQRDKTQAVKAQLQQEEQRLRALLGD
jgi:chromosome segregation ATPase